MSEPTVAAGLARGLMDLAVSKGADRKSLVERSGIALSDLQDQDARIPFAKYVMLMRLGKELCNDPALALHFGEEIDMSEISILGLIGPKSEMMIDGLAQLNRYARLVIEVDAGTSDRFHLLRGNGEYWLVDARETPNDFPELTESTFARMASGLHQFSETPFLKEIHVTHADPGYSAEYDRVFKVPVFFGSDRNAILIDEVFLDQKIDLPPPYIFDILSERAEALLENLDSSKSIRNHVESLLMPILHTGGSSMDAIAGTMGITRQALFRKLREEGVTFEQVRDDMRHKIAMYYLSEKKFSVSETAYRVGFSEPAAFSRAFKRWTGLSPREVRSPKFRKSEVAPGSSGPVT